MRVAIVSATLLAIVCVGALMVLSGPEDGPIIAEELDVDLRTDRTVECAGALRQLKDHHDTFWRRVKEGLQQAYGQQRAMSLQRSFVAKLDRIEARMRHNSCHVGPANDSDPAGCTALRQQRLRAARAVKEKASRLLSRRVRGFSAFSRRLHRRMKRLQDRVLRLHCSAAPAQHRASSSRHESDAGWNEGQQAELTAVPTRRHSNHKSYVRPHLTQAIGDVFDQAFKTGAGGGVAGGLLQEGATAGVYRTSTAASDALTSFNAAIKKTNPSLTSSKLKTTEAQEIKKVELTHPGKKAAAATAQAVAIVKNSVAGAAKAAAKVALAKASKLGLSSAETKKYVANAAKDAATAAAKDSSKVYAKALKTAPTPKMRAEERLKQDQKELAVKAAQHKVSKEVSSKDIAKENVHKIDNKDHQARVLQRATAAAAKTLQAKLGYKSKSVTNSVASAAKNFQATEQAALNAESKAWSSEVGGADTYDDVEKQIQAYRARHGGSMESAARAWEASQVLKMKSRFARRYAKALADSPKTKTGQLQQQDQVDRQKVNADKMVIQHAEMEAVLARYNAEKLAKSNLRLKSALSKNKASVADKVQQMVGAAKLSGHGEGAAEKAALGKVLAKEAGTTEKALQAKNKAKADAKHAEAAKDAALKALHAARMKLQKLSKAAAKATTSLGSKLHSQLKAQKDEYKDRLAQAKHDVAMQITAKMRKLNDDALRKKVEEEKLILSKMVAKKTGDAEKKASDVADAADQAASAAKLLATKEQLDAKNVKAASRAMAKKAATRAQSAEAAEATQKHAMAAARKLALQHLHQFTEQLKMVDNERAVKSNARVNAEEEQVEKSTEDAASAARFAEEQLAESDILKSQAVISQVSAADEVLARAIYAANTADSRARGEAALEDEKGAVLAAQEATLRAKKEALARAKEQKSKLVLKAAEKRSKAEANVKEKGNKVLMKEKAQKKAKIAREGYSKGVKYMQQQYKNRLAKRQAKLSVESKAKGLLKGAVSQPRPKA